MSLLHVLAVRYYGFYHYEYFKFSFLFQWLIFFALDWLFSESFVVDIFNNLNFGFSENYYNASKLYISLEFKKACSMN